MSAIHDRLEELRLEYARGRVQLEGLDRQRVDVHETLLRISGAIQVLEELSTDGADRERSEPSLDAVGA